MNKLNLVVLYWNQAEYINKNLPGIIRQRNEEIHITVVDNGSDDGSVNAIKEICGDNPYVSCIFLNENTGITYPRKRGCTDIESEYVMFRDGDDSLTDDALSCALEAAETLNSDIISFIPNIITDVTDEKRLRDLGRWLDSPREPLSVQSEGELLEYGDFNFNVWNKITKRDILQKAFREIPDEKIVMFEDQLLFFMCFYYAKDYSFLDRKLYNYSYGNGMSTVMNISYDIALSYIDAYRVYKILDRWSEGKNIGPAAGERLRKINRDIFYRLSDILIKVNRKDAVKLLEYAGKKVDVQDLILSLCEYTIRYKTEYAGDIADICAESGVFKTEKKEVKTIATYYYRVYNGGVEGVISRITDMWVKSGYNVVLFTDSEPDPRDYPLNEKVKRIVLPVIEPLDTQSYKDRINAWTKAIKEYDIDTVVYHSWADFRMMTDILSVKRAGAGFIMHTHNLFCINLISKLPSNQYFNVILPKLFRLTDLVLTLSDVDTAWWRINGLTCIKVTNPCQLTLDETTAPLDGKRLLFVGRLAPEKQVEDALKIFSIVHKAVPDSTFTVLGEGDGKQYVASLHRIIEEEQLSECVNMAGYITDTREYYKNSDVLICTSKFEGQSLTFIESKICGLPIVSYNIANMDMTRYPQGVVVVEQNDIEGSRNRIIQIMNNPEYRKQLGREARKSVEKVYEGGLESQWDTIFKVARGEEEIPDKTCDTQSLAAAVSLYNQYIQNGMLINNENGRLNTNELTYYMKQYYALGRTIEELKSSKSYRLGQKIIGPLAKLRAIFRR